MLALRDWLGRRSVTKLEVIMMLVKYAIAYFKAALMVALLRRFPFLVRKNSTPATTAFLGVRGDVAEGSIILAVIGFPLACPLMCDSPVTLMSLLPSSFMEKRTPSIVNSL